MKMLAVSTALLTFSTVSLAQEMPVRLLCDGTFIEAQGADPNQLARTRSLHPRQARRIAIEVTKSGVRQLDSDLFRPCGRI